MTMLAELVFLAKTSYRVIRQPKINRGKSEVEHEYSDGWNQYWDHLKNARNLAEWLRIPGVEPETRYFNVDGRLRYSSFDSTGYYRTALLDALTGNFPAADSVTEFGSGLGRNILYLKSKLPGLKAYGYELCKPGVEIANEAARKFDLDCQYRQLDYVRDPKEAYVFPITDVAYTMFSLEQIPSQNRTAVEHIRDHCLLGSIHIEPVPENYPFTFRGVLGKLDHWKVDYLSGFDRNVRALKFADVSIKRLSSSHNPLMFPSVYVLRKATQQLESNKKVLGQRA
jgi:hypothetical protein